MAARARFEKLTMPSREEMEPYLTKPPPPLEPTPTFREVLQLAKQEAEYHGHGYLDTQHLLLALAKCSRAFTKPFLEAHGIGIKQARDFIVALHDATKSPAHEVGHGLPGAEFGDTPDKTVAGLVDVIRQQREVVQGNRCGFCGAVSPQFPECCPKMKAEFARLEVTFWGPSKVDAISAWVVPQADEPAVVPSKEPS